MSRGSANAGFTLIELVVVMGLLASFLLMLVQLLGSGVEMFQEGQRSQDLADRAQLAARATEDVFAAMVGPAEEAFEPRDPAARLLVTWEDLGLPAEDGQPHDRVQIVRATVALDEDEESRLLAELYRPMLEEEGLGSQQIEERLARMLAEAPRRGRGDMLLVPWPVDAQGVFLELRRGLFARQDEFAIMEVEEFGGEPFPAELLVGVTEPIAADLLHFEVALWSRATRSWAREPGSDGPEYAWDSARAGRLLEVDDQAPRRERFGLDLGPDSRRDPRDDTFPRWARITLVVASPTVPAEAFLVDPLDDSARQLRLNRTDRLPSELESRWVKVGAEWMRFDEIRGSLLTGLRRGERGTLARQHAAGTAVRAGRTVVLYHKLEHGRDGGDV